MSKISVVARVVVTVEFTLGSWDGDSKFSDLSETAKREAANALRNKMGTDLRIIGEPRLVATVYEATP